MCHDGRVCKMRQGAKGAEPHQGMELRSNDREGALSDLLKTFIPFF